MRIPEAWIVAVGDDVAAGRHGDAGAARLAAELEALGCELRGRMLVPARAPRVAEAVRTAAGAGVDLVVVVGLGLAADQPTREGIAEALLRRLAPDAAALAVIEQRYLDRGREVPANAAGLARMPGGAELVPNPVGAVPGFLVDLGRSLVVALPGAVRELEESFARSVRPRLRTRFEGALAVRTAVLRVAGLLEAEVERRVTASGARSDAVRVGLSTEHGEVEVLVTARGESDDEAASRADAAVAALDARLGDFVYGRDDASLVAVLRDALARRGWTLAVAESITGGLLAKRITDLPGAGSFFVGAMVPYSDRRKPEMLDVAPGVFEACGRVSAAAAQTMAEAVRARLSADVALASTGIAGPGGGTTDKPVGLAYIAIAWPDRTIVRRHLFVGDRSAIRHQVAATALDQARRALAGLPPLGDAPEEGEDGAP